jgi:two-component system cell cycle sensor histidine kinase/response regulator CckA
VVEDNTVTRTAIVESLRMLNYEVLEAGDGIEALEVLDQAGEAVQLVLTDLVMPRMGGRELIQVLRQRSEPIRIAAMTAHPLDDFVDELQAMRVYDWLHKPPSLNKLAQIVSRALERQP